MALIACALAGDKLTVDAFLLRLTAEAKKLAVEDPGVPCLSFFLKYFLRNPPEDGGARDAEGGGGGAVSRRKSHRSLV